MSNGGVLGRRNVPGVDGFSGVWSLREIANARRAGVVFPLFYDTFETDTTAQYTQFSDSPATWAISGGELVATGGTQSNFIRNGITIADALVEAEISQANQGGSILRFVDQSNFYLLSVNDDSGWSSASNLQIWKRVSGTFTQIGASIDLAWTRGVSHKFGFSASGTTIKAFFDGTEVLSVTDSAITSAGGLGVRHNMLTSGVTEKYQSLVAFPQ